MQAFIFYHFLLPGKYFIVCISSLPGSSKFQWLSVLKERCESFTTFTGPQWRSKNSHIKIKSHFFRYQGIKGAGSG
jgi:hypothetical protein